MNSTPEALHFNCDCGEGRLRWERRKSWGDETASWLATCSDANCGLVATYSEQDGQNSPDALRRFMLGVCPVQPDVPPWLRLFLRYQHPAVSWTPTGSPCGRCGRSMEMRLMIPWRRERKADPLGALVCLDCGSLACEFWLDGERTELFLDSSAWTDMPVAVQALKRALADRCSITSDDGDDSDGPWQF